MRARRAERAARVEGLLADIDAVVATLRHELRSVPDRREERPPDGHLENDCP